MVRATRLVIACLNQCAIFEYYETLQLYVVPGQAQACGHRIDLRVDARGKETRDRLKEAVLRLAHVLPRCRREGKPLRMVHALRALGLFFCDSPARTRVMPAPQGIYTTGFYDNGLIRREVP